LVKLGIYATKKAMKMRGHMDRLLVAAAVAADAGEVPVAAAIVNVDGQIIALAENRMKRDGNALHHAEMLAIQAAMSKTGQSRLDEYDLWVTLEPCTMCAGAIAHARIKRLYFAAHDEKAGAVESGVRFFDSPSCNHSPEIYSGIGASKAAVMLREFFAVRR
jgi:tRNA(adenine34) deaminase